MLRKGDFGVPQFFVISGFIISFPFARRALAGTPGVPIRKYLVRRLTRLEPPYIINLSLMLAAAVLVRGVGFRELLPHYLASLAYQHNVTFARPSMSTSWPGPWRFECQFYLLAPLLVSVFRIRRATPRRLLLGMAIAVAMLGGQLLNPGNPRWTLSLFHYAGYFLTGFMLAEIYLVSWKSVPQRGWRWDLIGIVSWVSIAAILYLPSEFLVLTTLPILGAYCSAFRGRFSNAVFRNPFVYVIGGMCYTIYLYHWLVISGAGRIALRLPVLALLPLWARIMVMAVMVVPPVVAVSAVLFVIAEKPFMRPGWPIRLKERLQFAFARTSYE